MTIDSISENQASQILENLIPGSTKPDANLGFGNPDPYASISLPVLAGIVGKETAGAAQLHLDLSPYVRGFNEGLGNQVSNGHLKREEETVQVYTDRITARAEGREPQIAGGLARSA